jgi:type IV pilus assembly protein PilO
MIDFSELRDIDIGDFSTWPIWFRWTAIVLVSGGVLFGGFKYFLEPENLILTKLERKETQLKKIFLKKKELVINLPAYRAQMKEIQDRFGVVLRQLPNKTEVPALLIDITQAGLARGLKFEQFKPARPRTKEFYKVMPISITVTGRFHQMAEFISDLASLPRIVTVGNMKINRKDKSRKKQELVMKASLFTYQYLEDNTIDRPTKKKVRVQG